MIQENQITENQSSIASQNSAEEDFETVSRPVPAPSRLGTFEEALEVGLKKYDNALRELAK